MGGFGPLRPNWLTMVNPTFVQEKTVGSRNCYEWASGSAGDWFMMKSDNWAVDKDGIPCTYQDVFRTIPRWLGLEHILTFDVDSYSTAIEDDFFKLPVGMDCSAACSNTAGMWCTAR